MRKVVEKQRGRTAELQAAGHRSLRIGRLHHARVRNAAAIQGNDGAISWFVSQVRPRGDTDGYHHLRDV